MSLDAWLWFLPACFAINLAPGPNNLLAMSNAVRFGFAQAVLGAWGRMVAFAGMIALSAIGLGAVLAASALAFEIIKWCGAAYLVYLGIKLWRSPPLTLEDRLKAGAVSVTDMARSDFLIAIGNPKAILVFTAFFPQFLTPGAAAIPQFAALSRTPHGQIVLNRISGSVMIGAGALLAATRRTGAA